MIAKPTSSDLPDGRTRASACSPSGTSSTAARTEGLRAAMAPTSPCADPLLQRVDLDRPEEAHLALELDAELLQGAPPSLVHERDGVRRAPAAPVFDEIAMPRGDLRAPDAVPLEPAGLEHPSGRQLVVRVLEDAPECALVRRLGRLALRLELGDGRLDLVNRLWREPKLGGRHHLMRLESRAAGIQNPPLRG